MISSDEVAPLRTGPGPSLRWRGGGAPQTRTKVAFVLWDGNIGGAEILTGELAAAMRRAHVDASILFIGSPDPLGPRLDGLCVPFATLELKRGRDVLRAGRLLARTLAVMAPGGVVLPECGFLGATLRTAGYRAPIVAVEHGQLAQPATSSVQAGRRWLNGALGAFGDHVEVGVSEFMTARMRRGLHARLICRIYNGVDPDRFIVGKSLFEAGAGEPVVAVACRLIPGKGLPTALRAFARTSRFADARLRIAGVGPDLPSLARLAKQLDIAERVEFAGAVSDVTRFWRECDVALCPSETFVESFGMTALEAMACGRPVVATYNGGLPEIVRDGETGTIVPIGDQDQMAAALQRYLAHPELRRAHGSAGRLRAVSEFHIDGCAQTYLDCLRDARLVAFNARATRKFLSRPRRTSRREKRT